MLIHAISGRFVLFTVDEIWYLAVRRHSTSVRLSTALRYVHRPKRRTTLIAIVLNYLGLYCASSWSPRWGYIYVCHLISNSACSNIFSALPNCVYFRHDSYVLPNPALPNGIQAPGTPSTAIEDDFDQGCRLGQHPVMPLRTAPIIDIVFLTFWQSSFISLLSTFGVVKNVRSSNFEP